jgi:hypothetical protein
MVQDLAERLHGLRTTLWNGVPFSRAGPQTVIPPYFRIRGPTLQAWLFNSDVAMSDRWNRTGGLAKRYYLKDCKVGLWSSKMQLSQERS